MAAPFRTIQAALDNPNCVAGDTILVKPGFYDEGGWVDEYGYANRVNIAKDNITLKSTDGAAACVSGVNEFRSELPVNALGFMCAGAGYADISAFKRRTFGTMFHFR